MTNNKICNICYNNNINDNLKCKTCKNEVCDDCYANIVFNEDKFIFNFMQDKSFFKCPFCVSDNIFSTTINNYNTNNRLIKLLILKMNNGSINYKKLVHELNNLRNFNDEILNDNNDLENQISNLRKFNFELIKKNKELKALIPKPDIFSILENQTLELEYKPEKEKIEKMEKLEKIEILIKSTKKNTILYNQIHDILNK